MQSGPAETQGGGALLGLGHRRRIGLHREGAGILLLHIRGMISASGFLHMYMVKVGKRCV